MQHGTSMTLDMVKAGLALVDPTELHVSFFGGEPILKWDLITQTVDLVKGRMAKCRFHMTTNGTLLSKEHAQYLRANQPFSVLVSLDGPRDIHEANRPMAVNQEGHSLTLQALGRLREAGLSPTVRGTWTKDNFHLTERLRYLHEEIVDRQLACQVALEPIDTGESNCTDPASAASMGFSASDTPLVQAEMREAFAWIRSRVQQGKRVYWKFLNDMTRRILQRACNPSECGAGKGYICVTPDGLLHACHHEAGQPIGTVAAGFDEAARCQWWENRYYNRLDCPACPVRNLCGGGCRASSLSYTGNIRQPYKSACIFTQIMISETVKLLADLGEGERRLV